MTKISAAENQKQSHSFWEKIFSVKNEYRNSIKYKILNILGIKITFKGNNKDTKKLYEKINNNYETNIKRLKTKIADNKKIEIIFLVNEISKWKCETLFEILNKSPYFNANIAVTIADRQCDLALEEKNNILQDTYSFFHSRGYNTYIAYDIDNDCAIDLAKFNPDIIFYQQPYDLDYNQDVLRASKISLTYYIPYYLPDYYNPEFGYEYDFHKMLYRYYLLNKDYVQSITEAIPEGVIHLDNLVGLGHPFIDFIKQKCLDSQNEGYVIYAPHWSITEKGNENTINISTFNYTGDKILQYAQQHKEIKWVFKPHPTLKNALLLIGKTQEEIDNYYNEWEKFAICCYDNSYIDLFKKSKALITDCGSFCLEYFCTGKPLIHLVSPHNKNKPYDFLNDMFKSFYNVTSYEELDKLFQQILIENKDVKKEERYCVLKKMDFLSNNSSLNILKDLENTLGIEDSE